MSMPKQDLDRRRGLLAGAVEAAEEREEQRRQGEDEEGLEELVGLRPEPFQDDGRALGEEGQAEGVLIEGDPEEDDDEEEDDERRDALVLLAPVRSVAGGGGDRGGNVRGGVLARAGRGAPQHAVHGPQVGLARPEDDQGEDHAGRRDPEREGVAVEDGVVESGHERGDHGPEVHAHVEDVVAGVLEMGLVGIEAADENGHVDLEDARAQADEEEPEVERRDAAGPGDGQTDVAEGHEEGAGPDRPDLPDDPVAQPAAE